MTYLWWVPDAFAGGKIGVHKVARTRFYDFHPFYAVPSGGGEGKVKKTLEERRYTVIGVKNNIVIPL